MDTTVPVFSVINDGTDKSFIVSEVTDHVTVGEAGMEVPVNFTDITEMNYLFFDKVKIFNLKNKRIKKLSFVFSRFELDGVQILLGDNFLFVDSPKLDLGIAQTLQQAGHDKVRNLNMYISSLRMPKYSFQFYLYWLSKLRDTVTIPRPGIPDTEITYADCVFAKDLLLA